MRFNPGHFSHLVANYSLLETAGFVSDLFIHEKFNDFDTFGLYRKFNKIELNDYLSYNCAIFWFPSYKNPIEILKFRFLGSVKVIYVFHEPIDSYYEFYKSGFSLFKIFKLFLINIINKLTVLSASHILLPSKKAYEIYDKKYSNLNSKYSLIPLFFDDENISPSTSLVNRKYISYIGTIASDHAFQKFFNFIEFALNNEFS